MTLQDQVVSWQDTWATAPIFRAGQEWIDGKGKTHVSDGKQPLPKSRYVKYTAQHSVSMAGDEFSAVGIWFGPRSNGLVCLDIDGNLDKFLKRHPSILDGAHIKSPKTDRAKVLFQVPEELWQDVKGYDNSTDTYQVLWDGKMGVCAGEYGAGGHYTFVPGDVPQAPDWMLEEMLATKQRRNKVQLNTADMRCDTVEEAEGKLRDWLSVIPFEGDWLGEDLDTESWWFRVGACIAGAGIGERGLEVWRWHSQLDKRYESDWQHSDPCDERWWSLTVDGGLGPGTLCKLADQYDPERKRIKPVLNKPLEEVTDQYDKVIQRLKEIDKIEEVGRRRFLLTQVASEINDRGGADAMEDMLLREWMDKTQQENLTIAQLRQKLRSRDKEKTVIPGFLEKGKFCLMWGEGGTGKTATMLAIAKHVLTGNPWNINGDKVPVGVGPVVYFNSDSPEGEFEEACGVAEITDDMALHVVQGWNFTRKLKFAKLMNQIEPALVVIDSLTACNLSNISDENKSSYVAPLQWYIENNGVLWPPTCIVVITHARDDNTKYRGTTALRAMVQEEFSLKHPSDPASEVDPASTRYIQIHKSRAGRKGKVFRQVQQWDLTYALEEVGKPSEKRTKADVLRDKVIHKLRICGGSCITKAALMADPLVSAQYKGNESALGIALWKVLKGLLNEGRAYHGPEVRQGGKGRPQKTYGLVLDKSVSASNIARSEKNPQTPLSDRDYLISNGDLMEGGGDLIEGETGETGLNLSSFPPNGPEKLNKPSDTNGSGIILKNPGSYKGGLDPFSSEGLTD